MPRTQATLECSFGNVTKSPNSRSLPIKTDRTKLTAEEVDELVTGGHLEVSICANPKARKGQEKPDVPGQALIGGGSIKVIEIETTATCGAVNLKLEQFGFTLKIPKGAKSLDRLPGCSGKITIKRIGDATKEAAEEDEDGDD